MDDNRKIILNRIRCVHCNDTIISYHVHDYKTCICGIVSVDGGTEYLKRGFQIATDYVDSSLYDDEPFEIIRENFHWGTLGKDGKSPMWITISKMTNAHLNNILRDIRQGASWIRKLFMRELEYRKKNKIFIEE